MIKDTINCNFCVTLVTDKLIDYDVVKIVNRYVYCSVRHLVVRAPETTKKVAGQSKVMQLSDCQP